MHIRIISIVVLSICTTAPDVIAFRQENYIEPSVGAVRGEFTLRMKLGHMITERFSIEVGASFTPETLQKFSAITYSGALKVSVREVSPVEVIEPFLSVAAGSYSLLGKGRRETDPVIIQEVGINLRINKRIGWLLEGGNLTIFGESDMTNLGFYSVGLFFLL